MSDVSQPISPARIPARGLLALVILYLAVTLPFLGRPALFDPDEGYYPETAREMILAGDWLDPVFNGVPRWGKPVAFYLADAVSMSVFGANEFAARLPSALAGLGLTLVTALAGVTLFGTGAGLLSGVLCATAVHTAVYSRSAVPDMFLTFFVSLSLLSFLRASLHRERPGGPWLWTMYAAAGLAFLSKGPLGAILPAIAIFSFLALSRRWRDMLELKPLRGLLVFLVVSAPWYGYMYTLHGMDFLTEHFIGGNVQRYFTNRWEHDGPLWYYLPVLIAGTFPWTVAFAAGTVSSIRAALARDDRYQSHIFLLCWLAGMLVFFSFSRSKLPNYVLPLLPAALIIAARLIDTLSERGARRQTLALAWSSSGMALLLAIVGAVLLSRKLGEPASRLFLWLSPLSLAAVSSVLVHFRRAGLRAWAWSSALAMALLLAVLTGAAIPRVDRLQAVRGLAEDSRGRLEPGETVAAWRVWNPSFLFYTGARVYRFNPESESWPPAGEGKIGWIITRADALEEVLERTGAKASLVLERDRYRLIRLGGE